MILSRFLRTTFILVLALAAQTRLLADTYYVSVNGNDGGDGTVANPWRTLRHALASIPGLGEHTVSLSPGVFIEEKGLEVRPGLSIEGAGMDQTVLKAHPSLYHAYKSDADYAFDKYLLQLSGPKPQQGNQRLKGFSIDGDGKKLHGGIFIYRRDNVTVEQVAVRGTNFNGIWLTEVKTALVREVRLVNCAWGSVDWCSGALQLGNARNLEIDDVDISEDTGYGIKGLGPDRPQFFNVSIHDSRISVNPVGLWREGKSPNVAIELWANAFPGCSIYNCYIDNVVSLVNLDDNVRPTGEPLRIHHNIFDLMTRAKGKGYAVELAITDVSFDHNWIYGGHCGIANWGKAVSNWNVHHNTFYGIANIYPTAVIISHRGGFKDVNLFNNTVEMTGTSTVSFLQVDNAGVAENVSIKNNLLINSTTKTDHYPNGLIRLDNGATIKNMSVSNNLLFKVENGNAAGDFTNNLSVDPQISRKGKRPAPYYVPRTGSPLIDAGANVGLPYEGNAADIGAYEAVPDIK